MAKKKSLSVSISITPNSFTTIFKRFRGEKPELDLSGVSDLRKLLSNEKAKVIYTIKNENPESIYNLSKLLKRDFKSVSEDIKVLKKFGVIELEKAVKGKRKMLKPVLAIDSLNITFEV